MNYTETYTLLQTIDQAKKATSFLRDRYFPTNPNTDIFASEKVIAEIRKGNSKMAPFVIPRKDGVELTRDAYSIREIEPAKIAPKRALTIDDLKKKGFGEALFSDMSEENRALALTLQDMLELDATITRREEWMAMNAMFANGIQMDYYADDGSLYETDNVKFYTELSNPAEYSPQYTWDNANGDIVGDIMAMVDFLVSEGNAAEDVILGAEAAAYFIKDQNIQKLLDNRNFQIGTYAPELLPDGAAILAKLNIEGHMLRFITYAASVWDEGTSTMVKLIPEKWIVMTAPGAGRTVYGAVTQLEQKDAEFHTYKGTRVPHHVADAGTNSKYISLTAKPMMIPNAVNPWVSAKVIA